MSMVVKHNGPEVVKAIGKAPARAAGALSAAMNTLVRRAQFDVLAAMPKVFDRPTPYALNGLRVGMASATSIKASVAVKGKQDVGGGAIPAESFLRAEVEGGGRHDKRSEVLLRRAGLLPAGWVTVPGEGARLDGYGNMSRGQIVQIISYFEAFPQAGYRANSTKASRLKKARSTARRNGFTYFAVKPGTKGLASGIWERREGGALGKGVRCVIKFVRGVRYRKRLDFYGIAETSINANLGVQFDRELARAVA